MTAENSIEGKLQATGNSQDLVVVSEDTRKLEIMQLLHEYNDIKDATQNVLGALADVEQKTLKQMHIEFGLPLE